MAGGEGTGARRALLSVSDKTGIVELARGLARHGFTLLSTGGTARHLREAGLAVVEVSEHTGHPEIMDGRVKTLHPRIAGGVLGRRGRDEAEAAAVGIDWIDVVAVNLYPFERTVAAGGDDLPVDEAMEQVDIGGPTLLRAAAKNHAHVSVLCDPADYADFLAALDAGGPDLALRRRLALRAFRHTACYDAVIADWLAARADDAEPMVEGAIPLRRAAALRYGENPHQRGAFYAQPGERGRSLARARQVQGGPLSYNNIADLDAAVRAVFDLDEPACVVVKHGNPCGAATSPAGPARAFELALSADPVSAYGGILAFNRPLDGEAVRAIRKARTFFEVLAAPGYSELARERLAPRERLRVLELPADWGELPLAGRDARRVAGGWLLQDWDGEAPEERGPWRVATRRAPTAAEAAALRFAWRVARHVRSNAIVLARPAEATAEDADPAHLPEGDAPAGLVLNGVGAGQMSRVDAVRLALAKATRPVAGSVLASDAFFPFPDGVEEAARAGVRAIVQPGGSVRDEAVIAAADAAGLAMVFTGARHFRH